MVHEQLLLVKDGFRPDEDLFEQVGLYDGNVSECGERVSEWYVTTQDVARWLGQLQECPDPD